MVHPAEVCKLIVNAAVRFEEQVQHRGQVQNETREAGERVLMDSILGQPIPRIRFPILGWQFDGRHERLDVLCREPTIADDTQSFTSQRVSIAIACKGVLPVSNGVFLGFIYASEA